MTSFHVLYIPISRLHDCIAILSITCAHLHICRLHYSWDPFQSLKSNMHFSFVENRLRNSSAKVLPLPLAQLLVLQFFSFVRNDRRCWDSSGRLTFRADVADLMHMDTRRCSCVSLTPRASKRERPTLHSHRAIEARYELGVADFAQSTFHSRIPDHSP